MTKAYFIICLFALLKLISAAVIDRNKLPPNTTDNLSTQTFSPAPNNVIKDIGTVLFPDPNVDTNDTSAVILRQALASIQTGTVIGGVLFTQYQQSPRLVVTAKFIGLTPGEHAFDIHRRPVTTGCGSTGPHFEPNDPSNDAIPDVGGLMPLIAGPDGVAIVNYEDPGLTFEGQANIIGRSIAIHAMPPKSGATGGRRIACATIQIR
jgi:Cu/Zn superoxide dismutase